MVRSSQNDKNALALENLRAKTQEGNTETGQMVPFFSSAFSALFVTFISEFEITQNSFLCGSPL